MAMSNMAGLLDSNDDDTREDLNLPNGIGRDLLQIDGVWSRFKCLKKLDLNSSELSNLPSGLEALSPTLEILFLSENKFVAFPEVIGKLSNLRMLSLRGNRLTELSTTNLPADSLVWLILTNNQISRIDPNICELKHLRKLMLSHNKLSFVPPEFESCKDLELIRLANNEITQELPRGFLSLPKLAWISLAGNPIAHCPATKEKTILKSSVSFDESKILGRGASGIVYSGQYAGQDVAVKLFHQQSKGSDGNPEDEAAINARVDHPLAVSALGVFLCDQNEKHEGMVMQLLDGAKAVGKVPSFATVTRDAGPDDGAKDLDRESVLSIVWNVAVALEHVHTKAGVSNGDVYLHNILMCKGGIARISDWGASFIYDGYHDYAAIFERIEVLAFGRLIQDLFDWHLNSSLPDLTEAADFLGRTRGELIENGPFYDLMKSILQPDQIKRPPFKEIKVALSQLPEFEKAMRAADQILAELCCNRKVN